MTEEANAPHCPNHGVALDLTDEIGVGICPISGCYFQYEPILEEGKPKKVNKIKNGKIVEETQYIITKDGENHDFNVR